MQFSKEHQDDTTIIRVEGELDAMTAPELKPTLEEVAQARPKKVIMDLTHLRLIDSSGVGAVVSLFKSVREMGGQFQVVGVQGQPRSIFRVLRMDRVFNIA